MRKRAGLWVMSRNTQSAPLAFISASMPRATASRVARSPRGSYFVMKASPCWLTSTPPSPRTASEMRKFFASRLKKQVGWNWMNSRLATRAPAR